MTKESEVGVSGPIFCRPNPYYHKKIPTVNNLPIYFEDMIITSKMKGKSKTLYTFAINLPKNISSITVTSKH